jgi:hypothetical protein
MEPNLEKLIRENKPDFSNIPGGVELPIGFEVSGETFPEVVDIRQGDGAMLIKNAINPSACDELIKFFEESGKYAPVTIQGMQNVTDDNIGSNRITGFSPSIANDIWHYIRYSIHKIKVVNQYTSTDFWQGFSKMQYDWSAVGISPMLRFMRYQKHGQHYPHYDAGYIYPDKNYRTLKSFVLYLTTNQSGATRFIEDKQSHLTVFSRKHDDWSREPKPEEILYRNLPVKGDMLIFDHRICHDVESFNDIVGDRIIIRGDIIYKAI